MQRWRARHRNDGPSAGVGVTFLAVGMVAGLALGAFLADRLGGVGGISARVRGRMRGSNSGTDLPRASPSELPARATAEEEYVISEYEDAVELAPSEGDEIDGTRGNSTDVVGEDEKMDGDESEQAFTSADPDLEDRVLAAFTNDPVLSERAIDIGAISARTIELTGAVLTDAEYEHATVVTRGIPGVETVVNRLSIRESDATKERAARRYAAGDPRYTEARWENERVGTGRPRQGTSQDVGRHADPKVPLESRALDAAEAVRDAADDIPPAPPSRKRDEDRPPTGGAEAR
jgi:hypothetical protein